MDEASANVFAQRKKDKNITWLPYLPNDAKQDIQEIYERLDVDCKGYITQRELHAALSEALGKSVRAETVQTLAVRMDAARHLGHHVSYNDFVEYMAQKLLISESYDDLVRTEQGPLMKEVGYKLYEVLSMYKRKQMMKDAMMGSDGIARLLHLTNVPVQPRNRRKGQPGSDLLHNQADPSQSTRSRSRRAASGGTSAGAGSSAFPNGRSDVSRGGATDSRSTATTANGEDASASAPAGPAISSTPLQPSKAPLTASAAAAPIASRAKLPRERQSWQPGPVSRMRSTASTSAWAPAGREPSPGKEREPVQRWRKGMGLPASDGGTLGPEWTAEENIREEAIADAVELVGLGSRHREQQEAADGAAAPASAAGRHTPTTFRRLSTPVAAMLSGGTLPQPQPHPTASPTGLPPSVSFDRSVSPEPGEQGGGRCSASKRRACSTAVSISLPTTTGLLVHRGGGLGIPGSGPGGSRSVSPSPTALGPACQLLVASPIGGSSGGGAGGMAVAAGWRSPALQSQVVELEQAGLAEAHALGLDDVSGAGVQSHTFPMHGPMQQHLYQHSNSGTQRTRQPRKPALPAAARGSTSSGAPPPLMAPSRSLTFSAQTSFSPMCVRPCGATTLGISTLPPPGGLGLSGGLEGEKEPRQQILPQSLPTQLPPASPPMQSPQSPTQSDGGCARRAWIGEELEVTGQAPRRASGGGSGGGSVSWGPRSRPRFSAGAIAAAGAGAAPQLDTVRFEVSATSATAAAATTDPLASDPILSKLPNWVRKGIGLPPAPAPAPPAAHGDGLQPGSQPQPLPLAAAAAPLAPADAPGPLPIGNAPSGGACCLALSEIEASGSVPVQGAASRPEQVAASSVPCGGESGGGGVLIAEEGSRGVSAAQQGGEVHAVPSLRMSPGRGNSLRSPVVRFQPFGGDVAAVVAESAEEGGDGGARSPERAAGGAVVVVASTGLGSWEDPGLPETEGSFPQHTVLNIWAGSAAAAVADAFSGTTASAATTASGASMVGPPSPPARAADALSSPPRSLSFNIRRDASSSSSSSTAAVSASTSASTFTSASRAAYTRPADLQAAMAAVPSASFRYLSPLLLSSRKETSFRMPMEDGITAGGAAAAAGSVEGTVAALASDRLGGVGLGMSKEQLSAWEESVLSQRSSAGHGSLPGHGASDAEDEDDEGGEAFGPESADEIFARLFGSPRGKAAQAVAVAAAGDEAQSPRLPVPREQQLHHLRSMRQQRRQQSQRQCSGQRHVTAEGSAATADVSEAVTPRRKDAVEGAGGPTPQQQVGKDEAAGREQLRVLEEPQSQSQSQEDSCSRPAGASDSGASGGRHASSPPRSTVPLRFPRTPELELPRPRSAAPPRPAREVVTTAEVALAAADQTDNDVSITNSSQGIGGAAILKTRWSAEYVEGSVLLPPGAGGGGCYAGAGGVHCPPPAPRTPPAVRLNHTALLRLHTQYGGDLIEAAGTALGLGGTSAAAWQVGTRELLQTLEAKSGAKGCCRQCCEPPSLGGGSSIGGGISSSGGTTSGGSCGGGSSGQSRGRTRRVSASASACQSAHGGFTSHPTPLALLPSDIVAFSRQYRRQISRKSSDAGCTFARKALASQAAPQRTRPTSAASSAAFKAPVTRPGSAGPGGNTAGDARRVLAAPAASASGLVPPAARAPWPRPGSARAAVIPTAPSIVSGVRQLSDGEVALCLLQSAAARPASAGAARLAPHERPRTPPLTEPSFGSLTLPASPAVAVGGSTAGGRSSAAEARGSADGGGYGVSGRHRPPRSTDGRSVSSEGNGPEEPRRRKQLEVTGTGALVLRRSSSGASVGAGAGMGAGLRVG